jgi:hypothetical protein
MSKKDISQILKEAAKDILTEETLTEIKEAFDQAVNERVQIHVEKALVEQDEDYTNKLQHFIEATDKDHIAKLTRVVEALDANNYAKLQLVVENYTKIINESASEFKEELVHKISDFLELYIEEKIPQEQIEEAVSNQNAKILLQNLKETLAVDTALLSNVFKGALLDGKSQIEEAKKAKSDLEKELSLIKESLQKTKAELVLEQKTATLSDKKKAYARRVFEGKAPEFIEENLDYTISLFDKKEEERLTVLKEEAFQSRRVKSDRVVPQEVEEQEDVITESIDDEVQHTEFYMNELRKY